MCCLAQALSRAASLVLPRKPHASPTTCLAQAPTAAAATRTARLPARGHFPGRQGVLSQEAAPLSALPGGAWAVHPQPAGARGRAPPPEHRTGRPRVPESRNLVGHGSRVFRQPRRPAAAHGVVAIPAGGGATPAVPAGPQGIVRRTGGAQGPAPAHRRREGHRRAARGWGRRGRAVQGRRVRPDRPAAGRRALLRSNGRCAHPAQPGRGEAQVGGVTRAVDARGGGQPRQASAASRQGAGAGEHSHRAAAGAHGDGHWGGARAGNRRAAAGGRAAGAGGRGGRGGGHADEGGTAQAGRHGAGAVGQGGGGALVRGARGARARGGESRGGQGRHASEEG
eukprot:scaffold10130_cov97-Isochrysis_galbana.AAC.1